MVQMSELLFPGEIVLKSGESYKTPKLYSAFSRTGLNGMSQCFHKFLRNSREHIIFKRKERPVQFNTWEAVYFEHDISTLFKLVDSAYDLGIERFVLDDGWFKGRDSEKAGLGDWYIDKLKYPEGLKPLIEYINSKNMEFGLWFEPEMVNPDSDLFRLHPDWILGVDGYDQPKGRYQYVLDLSRKEVFEYILNRLDSLLTEYNIGYVKWDMNRDLSQPGNRFNIPSVHEQVKSYYKLLEFITRSHPDVEFESCASGGGRADFEVLRYTNRIWTSDCNDPFERHFIQKGFSYFLPPEIMGAHFGPSKAHTTLRETDLKFRILTCFFGHLGFEQNVLTLNKYERSELKKYVSLYKKYRKIVSNSTFFRIDSCDKNLDIYGTVSKNSDELLLMITQLSLPDFMIPERIKIPYIDKSVKYRIDILDIPESNFNTMKKNVEWPESKITYSGELLIKIGIQLPIMNPESVLFFRLKKIDDLLSY